MTHLSFLLEPRTKLTRVIKKQRVLSSPAEADPDLYDSWGRKGIFLLAKDYRLYVYSSGHSGCVKGATEVIEVYQLQTPLTSFSCRNYKMLNTVMYEVV